MEVEGGGGQSLKIQFPMRETNERKTFVPRRNWGPASPTATCLQTYMIITMQLSC